MKKLFFWCICTLSAASIYAQYTVQGLITDAASGETLVGVNILEIGTANGTTTDLDGRYQITVADENATLEFTYIGYISQQEAVSGKSNINITLSEGGTELDEVIVVGYGTQKKAVVTGAITQVKAADLEDMQVMRIEQSLVGRTSGVRVTSNSGQPGEGSTVRIRGTTTIGNSEPLYVVDGIPILGGIDFLNQGDIASIEVLKDAASAGIYGARSANGVILVTTKKGAQNGTTQINYSAYYGTQAPWRKLSLLNAREYGILMNESSVAAGGEILFDDPDALGEGTDWQDQIFRTDAPIMNHELRLTAGNATSQYFASFGYFTQEGIISDEASDYNRFTARFNSTHKIGNRFTFGNTLGYSRVMAQGVSTNSEFGSPLSRAINLDPLTPVLETDPEVLASNVFQNFPVVRNADGVPYGISTRVTSEILNPVAALEIQQGFGWSDKIVGNAFGEFQLGNFKLRSSIGTDLAFFGGEGFTPVHYLNSSNRVDINSYSRNQARGLYWIWENTLSYSNRIGDHNVTALVGTVAEQNKGQGIGGRVQDIPVDRLEDASLLFGTPVETQAFNGFEYLNTLTSYLGRVVYDYKSKYLFSATMRVDGSSRFGQNNRFGFFPSISLGWVLSEENFISNSSAINFMKLRASWGVNGNDRIGDFRFISTVGGFRNYTFGLDDQLVNGFSPNAIANPDLRWEQTTQTNVGLDMRVFKNLTITLDGFIKETTDMLLPIVVPGYVGNEGGIGNVANMENRGIELELGYDKEMKNGLIVGVSGNITYIENEVTFLGDDKDFLLGATFGPQGLQISRTQEGLPIGFFFGYETDGIFQTQAEVDAYVNAENELIQPNAAPGDFRFVDSNGDGVIDAEDRGMIGDPTPTWTYGATFDFEYKGIDLAIFTQGVAGNEIFKATRRFDLQGANLTSDALGRWTGEGTSNTYPRLVQNDPNQNFSRSSDFYVESGGFFRIKTFQLGYTLPQTLTQKASIDKLRLYVSANNLLTITKYTGLDPEIGGGSFGIDRGLYPQPRFFVFGVNLTL